MAIKKTDFPEKIEPGLKADKSFSKFLLRFKTEGSKEYSKVFDYSDRQWNKKTRVTQAKADALAYKTKIKQKSASAYVGFDENSTLNQVKDEYFKNACSDTNWTEERKDCYRLYLEQSLGKMKIKDIKLNHINIVRSQMEQKGHTKQTANGCSPRTIKKVLIQTLKPIMEYAYENQVISMVPKIELSPAHKKQHKAKKKKVENGTETLSILYRTIMELYKDNPFYRALFLFALYGRRWNEIRTLEWQNIDFHNNRYTIVSEKNKVDASQTYILSSDITEALYGILDDRTGLVFKSPKTGKMLYTPKKQLAKIKQISGIDNLTMHYFRHILVSAMGEVGVANTILSASLGHTNLNTVHQFYLSANHTKASQVAVEKIAEITKQCSGM